MPNSKPPSDPWEFAQSLWGKMGVTPPGMVAPIFDVAELEKRLADLKTVEGWLKMNLSLLQLTIQTLEMQCATLNAVRTMAQPAAAPTPPPAAKKSVEAGTEPATPDPLQPALWPWTLMQQMQTQMQQSVEKAAPARSPKAGKKAKPSP